MNDELHGPYHRTGEPGGPGAAVAVLPIQGKDPAGDVISASLPDAKNSTEVELLRTVCGGLGITWGQDDLGWWAVVPDVVSDAAQK
jgi:hypothetical protein